MKFYERYYASNYDELITHYPRFYRDVYEMREILKAYGRITDVLEGQVEQAFFNHFILTADAETIKIYEDMLGITYKEKLTLDQRKRVVIARLIGANHIGEPEIREVISNYTENAVAIDFARGVITVVIDGEIFDETNLLNTLLRRIPAHLALDMSIHVQREFRQRLDFGFGGAAGAHFSATPVGEDRASTMRLNVGYGGRAEAAFKTAPVGEDREARAAVSVGYSGLLSPKTAGVPPDTKRASTGRTEGAGGMYYHTHIKSKLIG